MDLANRAYAPSYESALERAAPLVERALGRPVGDALASFRSRPKMIEVLALALAERDERSTVDRATLARVQRTVEDALPRSLEDSTGFHARPKDPVEAFAFVGTRYPARTTPAMVDALRRAGYDDLGVLDLAIAIADANNWARMYRLLDLAPELLYIRPSAQQRA
jgi:alkylhydroperoxidase family enzyme